MARHKRHEDHQNHEAWAIPYGDLVTLLLAFFVVMYAISSVNEGKYRVLSDSLNEAFNGQSHPNRSPAVGAGAPRAIELPRNQVLRLIAPALPRASGLPLSGAQEAPRPAPAAAAHVPATIPPAAAQGGDLGRVADQVTDAMGALVSSGEVHVRRYQNWVAVDISADILFESGSARLAPAAVPVLQHLADTLKPFNNPVHVEGHTDDRPIRTAEFPSNWELSAARAASVVHLFMDRGIEADRMAVIGFGAQRPVATNATASGRNANRRVAVVILDGAAGGENH